MGLEANAAGDLPKIAPTAYVHPSAVVIGRVCIGDRVFIGPQAVIRADEPGPNGNIEPIVIDELTNVQDCAVIHALGGTGVVIGPGTSIAHAAVVHGPCKIGARCFVGFHSVVFHATLADGVIVMHQALVERASLSERLFVPSMSAICRDEDASRLEQATEEIVAFAERVVHTNVSLVEVFLRNR